MNDHPGPANVRSTDDEPASTRADARVPTVADWQRAADHGAADHGAAGVEGRSRPGAGTGGSTARSAPAPWTPASAALPSILRDELVDWCLGGLPNEACGLLVGDRPAEDGGVPIRFVGMRNAAASPYRYLIDADEQLRIMLEIDDADEVVWGIVHSHVASPAVPSATDVGLAAYPDALYLICSLASSHPVLRAWAITGGAMSEVVLEPV